MNTVKIKRSECSPKSRLITLLLCFFFGIFGVHRFYIKKIGAGILMIFTVGGCGIWALIDLCMIVFGAFADKNNKPVLIWEENIIIEDE